MWPSEKSCFLQWMVIFDFGRIRAIKGNQHVSFALKTPLQNLMERSNPERCQPCLSPCDHVSIQRQHPERMLLSSNWQLILQIMGWELVGPQGWAGPPAEAFALEGEQTAVFPSRVAGSWLSATMSAVTTAFPLPCNPVSVQRSNPGVYADANGCAGLSSLIPTCDAFLISLSSETLATRLALLCNPLQQRKQLLLVSVIPSLFCPLLALVVSLKQHGIKMNPRGCAQVRSQPSLWLSKGDPFLLPIDSKLKLM